MKMEKMSTYEMEKQRKKCQSLPFNCIYLLTIKEMTSIYFHSELYPEESFFKYINIPA